MVRALVNKLKEDKVYFPNYITETYTHWSKQNLSQDKYKVTFGTLVRIQGRDEKWYIVPFIKEFVNMYDKPGGFVSFLHDVYSLLIDGDIPIKIDEFVIKENFENNNFFELDELQISEQERMVKII